jgi:hypothetical protein
MAFEKGVDYEEMETKNWNVAKSYSQEKVQRWLVLIDEYHTLATFGYSKIDSDIFIRDSNLKNTARISAMHRLIHAMSTLIRNTKFAIHKKSKPKFEEYKERLLVIKNNIYKLRVEKKRGNKIVELEINEDLFEKINTELTDMIDNMNLILNDADLIFTHTEDYDPKKVKEALKERFINKN